MPFHPLFALLAQAAAPEGPGPSLSRSISETALGGTEGPDLTRYLLVCSAILLGVALLAWAFRRVVGRSLAAKAAKRSLQVVDVLPMGRQRLAVVRCYDRTFLLGMGEKEVSLVAELDPVIASAGDALPEGADREAFANLLEREVGRSASGQAAPRAVLTPAPRPVQRERGESGWVG